MTPDRFIAAAFREAVMRTPPDTDATKFVNAVWIERRAAELARESVGDGELLPCPFCGKSCAVLTNTKEMNKPNSCFMHTVVCDATADGCGTTVGYEFEAADAITAWNTRAAGDKE